MARKTKAKPVEDATIWKPPTESHFAVVDGVTRIKLTQEHLLRLELYFSQIRSLSAEMGVETLAIEILENRFAAEIRKKRENIQILMRNKELISAESKAFANNLSTVYGVDFKNVTYDSDTGIITVHNENESPKKDNVN